MVEALDEPDVMQALAAAAQQEGNEAEFTGGAWDWEPYNLSSDRSARAKVNTAQALPKTMPSVVPTAVHPALRPTPLQFPHPSAKPGQRVPVQDGTVPQGRPRPSGQSPNIFASSSTTPSTATYPAKTKCGDKKYLNSKMTDSALFDYDDPLSPQGFQHKARAQIDLRDVPPAKHEFLKFVQDDMSEAETSLLSNSDEETLTDVDEVERFVDDWLKESMDAEEDPADSAMPFLLDHTWALTNEWCETQHGDMV